MLETHEENITACYVSSLSVAECNLGKVKIETMLSSSLLHGSSSLIFVVEFNTLHMFQHLFRVSDAILVGGGGSQNDKITVNVWGK